MRKFLILLLCMITATALTACGDKTPTEDSSFLLKVVIQDDSADLNTYQYMAVYHDGKTSEIDEFEPDDMAFYTAAHGDFTSSIEKNSVLNSLKATTLIDENGNESEANDAIAAMMQTAADVIEHDIWQFQAITDGNRYFAFVKLNVNWQSPCVLYEYEAASGSLTELCRWDGVDLIGISI